VRDVILEVASAQFAALGYSETTMRSVAAGAGAALSVVQRHFPTKSDLFAASVLSHLLHDLTVSWRNELKESGLARDGELMQALVGMLYERFTRHRLGILEVLRQEHASAGSGGVELMRSVVAELLEALERFDGLARPQAPEMQWRNREQDALLLTSTVVGLVLARPLIPDAHWAGADTADTDIVDGIARFGQHALRCDLT
jgi:AcrR family transcriptional regulator